MRVLIGFVVNLGAGEIAFDYGRTDNSTSPTLLPLGMDFQVVFKLRTFGENNPKMDSIPKVGTVTIFNQYQLMFEVPINWTTSTRSTLTPMEYRFYHQFKSGSN